MCLVRTGGLRPVCIIPSIAHRVCTDGRIISGVDGQRFVGKFDDDDISGNLQKAATVKLNKLSIYELFYNVIDTS